MRKRTLAISTALLLATTAVGCSSSDDKSSDGTKTVRGIATLSVTEQGRTVRVYDPENGKVILTKHFSIGDKQQTLANCSNAGELSAFTPDYSKMIARQSYGSGKHVGLLEGTDSPKRVSKFTDLSGDTESKGKPVVQSTGAFGPNGKLYAIERNDAGQIVKAIDPSSGESEALNIKPTWIELDESGNQVTRQATAEETKPYFLPRGEEMEVDPSGHKVYSADGKWAFETPDDEHVSRGNLQKLSGKRYTVDMPRQDDGSVDPVAPVVVADEDSGLFVSYAGRNLYRGKFLREELLLTKVDLGTTGQIYLVAAPNTKSIGFIDMPESGGNGTLNVANVTTLKPRKLATLPSGHTCLLGWQ